MFTRQQIKWIADVLRDYPDEASVGKAEQEDLVTYMADKLKEVQDDKFSVVAFWMRAGYYT